MQTVLWPTHIQEKTPKFGPSVQKQKLVPLQEEPGTQSCQENQQLWQSQGKKHHWAHSFPEKAPIEQESSSRL
jgi:hypothetical protein